MYEALIKKDPDLPGYVEQMMGDEHDGFCEAICNKVSELENK